MNIYITKENEEDLRRFDGSMSGLINALLRDFFESNPTKEEKREVYEPFEG